MAGMVCIDGKKTLKKPVYQFALLVMVVLVLAACGNKDGGNRAAQHFTVIVQKPQGSDAAEIGHDDFFVVETDPVAGTITSYRKPQVSRNAVDDTWTVMVSGAITVHTLIVAGMNDSAGANRKIQPLQLVVGQSLPDNTLYAPLVGEKVLVNILSTLLADSAVVSALELVTAQDMFYLAAAVQLQLESFATGMQDGESFAAYKVRIKSSVSDGLARFITAATMPVPLLKEIEPVKKYTNNTAPEYTFASSAGGKMTWGGACSVDGEIATTGNNTVKFNPVPEGFYADCTVIVEDMLGRKSLPLHVSAFNIDMTSPELRLAEPINKLSNDTTPTFNIRSSENGTLEMAGACQTEVSALKAGGNVITLSAMAGGIYTNCGIRSADVAGNYSSLVVIPKFTIDITLPVVSEVSPVKTPWFDVRPSLIIKTSKPGEIIFNGKCSGFRKQVKEGNNRIAFWTLPLGKYDNCTFSLRDMANNISLPVAVSPFEIIANEYETYWSEFSVEQGGNISLFVSTTKETFNLDIYATAPDSDKPILSVGNIRGGLQNRDGSKVTVPSTWKENYKLDIDSSWKSGIYKAKIGNNTSYFTVKASSPGSSSSILVVDSSPTRIAYNNWGGKSFYGNNSTYGIPSEKSLLKRPGQNKVDIEEISFSLWSNKHNIPLEFASMFDLHDNPGLLSNYKLVVFVGHNEYWSYEMRNHFDDFIRSGGNAMILGGNTMLWQVRLDRENLICFKSPFDPIALSAPEKTTHYWSKPPVNRPQNLSIGLGWDEGGYVNNGGYQVADSTHWVYAGTGMANNKKFGVSTNILGYEVDGVDFTFVDGKPVLTGKDATPANLQILAFADAYAETGDHKGHAVMAMVTPFSGGGQVFNAGTIDWADGLWYMGKNKGYEDPVVGKITMNVITEFLK